MTVAINVTYKGYDGTISVDTINTPDDVNIEVTRFKRLVEGIIANGLEPQPRVSFKSGGGKSKPDVNIEIKDDTIRVLFNAPYDFATKKRDFDKKKLWQKTVTNKLAYTIDKVDTTTNSGKTYQEWWYVFGLGFASEIKSRLNELSVKVDGIEQLDDVDVEQVEITNVTKIDPEDEKRKDLLRTAAILSKKIWGDEDAEKERHQAAAKVNPVASRASELTTNMQIQILVNAFKGMLTARSIWTGYDESELDENGNPVKIKPYVEFSKWLDHHYKVTSPYDLNIQESDNMVAHIGNEKLKMKKAAGE